jgi:hypothetical protein
MATVTGTIQQQARFGLPAINAPSPFGVPAEMPKLDRSYATGTGANQVDGIHCKTYSLVATSTTLDLTAMTDPNGASITCTTGRVREFILQNTSAFPIILGAAAATQWTGMISALAASGTVTVPPNGILHFSDPTTVGASGALVSASSKSLKIDAGANTVSFNLTIAFCSAQS